MKTFKNIIGSVSILLFLLAFSEMGNAEIQDEFDISKEYEIVKMNDGYAGKYYPLSGRIGISETFQNDNFVIYHELSHRFFDEKLSEIEKAEWEKIYKDCFSIFPITDFSFVSFYSKFDKYEDFAETSSMFWNSSEYLIFLSEKNEHIKRKLSFLEKVFEKKLEKKGEKKFQIRMQYFLHIK